MLPDRIKINLCGIIFEVRRATLSRIADTRLTNLQVTDPEYDRARDQWMFDRNSALFPYILDAYR